MLPLYIWLQLMIRKILISLALNQIALFSFGGLENDQIRDQHDIDSINKVVHDIYPLETKKAFELAETCHRLSLSSDYTNGLAHAKHNLGLIHLLNSEYDVAQKYLFDAVRLFENAGIRMKYFRVDKESVHCFLEPVNMKKHWIIPARC